MVKDSEQSQENKLKLLEVILNDISDKKTPLTGDRVSMSEKLKHKYIRQSEALHSRISEDANELPSFNSPEQKDRVVSNPMSKTPISEMGDVDVKGKQVDKGNIAQVVNKGVFILYIG